MKSRNTFTSVSPLGIAGFVLTVLVAAPGPTVAQVASQHPATFSKDVAPILQRSCENCHRAGGGAPMSLVTYSEVRPWARALKARTAAREMPPWFIDKNIGIQQFKDDPSLSDDEIATIAAWADAGAPQGDPADLPAPREWAERGKWSMGKPDLVISSPVSTVEALAPDWYGMVNPPSPTGLAEDRWIKAVEIKEVIVDDEGREVVPAVDGTAAGVDRAELNLFVVHHSVINAKRNSAPDDDVHPNSGGESAAAKREPGLFGIVHELGQNATVFPDYVGVKLPGDSALTYTNIHLHSIGKRVHVRVDTAFQFHPAGYEPKYVQTSGSQAGGFELEIDIPAGDNDVMRDGFFRVTSPMILMTFEPHLHSSGKRMCIEALYPNNMREMLNCAEYNHNWVKVYVYEDEAAPLLPAGTVLHMLAWYDNSPTNPRVVDPRNWKGWGNRSIDDMFYHLPRMVFLTDEQFETEVAARETPPLFAATQNQ